MVRRCRLLAIGLVFLFFLSACGVQVEISQDPVERPELSANGYDFQETDELVIWTDSMTLLKDKTVVDLFQEKYPNIQVSVQMLPEKEGSIEEASLFFPREIGDNIPDLVCFSNGISSLEVQWGNADYTYADIYKLMDAGFFLDLQGIMAEDSEFQVERYDSRVLGAGQYRGGQYLLPAAFGTGGRTLLGSGEVLSQTKFTMDSVPDAEALLKLLKDLREELKMEAVLSGPEYRSSGLHELIFSACNVQLLDRDQGKVILDPKEFQNFCDVWKGLFYPDSCEQENTYGPAGEIKKLKERSALFVLTDSLSLASFSALKASQTPVVFNFPDVEGKVIGEPYECMGICTEGKNQKNAWTFIKFMLSEEVQSDPGQLGYEQMPVLLSAQEMNLEKNYAVAERAAALSLYGEGAALTKGEQEMCAAAIRGIDRCQISSPEIYQIFEQNMSPFFQGKSEFNTCLKALDQSLREYMKS